VGIRFGSRALGYIGHTGTISNNVITGPAKGGIVVDGDATNVTVTGNTVTGLNVVGIIGQNGIQISRGARAVVDSNNVSGFRYGDTFSNLSAAGILVFDVVGGNLTITNNTVSGSDEGIGVYHTPAYLADGTTVDYNTQFNVAATIKKNQVNNNVYLGIHIDPFSKGSTIWNNTVTGNAGGWDELDEHPDFNSNDWGSDPSQYNTVGTVHAGLVFTY
jgi:Right handed beta helix region